MKRYLPSLFYIILILGLLRIPTGFEDAVIYKGTDRVKAEVLSVSNEDLIETGLIKSGDQRCKVKLLGGLFKGEEVEAVNLLSGSLESDKLFKAGDVAFVVVSHQEGEVKSVRMIDHYRLNKEAILALVFLIFLVSFAGKVGLRAVLSFMITVLMIWKILIPNYLRGVNPILIGIFIVLLLTGVIISLVYGFDKRTLASSLGAALGIFTTCILGIIFTDAFKIHGAIMSQSESLLYSGYQHLNLTQIYMASIFIGASGAMMDLAVDITSAVDEVVKTSPKIGFKAAAASGMAVGRAAIGTMTTTLLLAYSGGYIALLMVFMAQGTPIDNILNYKYVAAEMVDTMVGSFGLVTVAPFTALTSGFFLTRTQGIREEDSIPNEMSISYNS